jgi:hypothetical protein
MCGVPPPLPQYASMAWCSVKKSTGTTLPLPNHIVFMLLHNPNSLFGWDTLNVLLGRWCCILAVREAASILPMWSRRHFMQLTCILVSISVTLHIHTWQGARHGNGRVLCACVGTEQRNNKSRSDFLASWPSDSYRDGLIFHYTVWALTLSRGYLGTRVVEVVVSQS